MERNIDDNMDEKLQHFGIILKYRFFQAKNTLFFKHTYK